MAHGQVPADMITRLQGKKILVLGDLMLDAYLMGDAERLSPEAPVPVVSIAEEIHFLGGAGNVARNAAALGGAVTLVGVTGKDAGAEDLTQLLQQEKIISGLVALGSRPTTVKTRVMARRQQMLRLDREDVRPLAGKDLETVLAQVDAVLDGHDVIIVSDYNKGLISKNFMLHLDSCLRARNLTPRILVDPKPANMPLYTCATLLTPNAKETGEGAGLPVRNREEVLAAGTRILEQVGCEHLLTTLGPDGMALFVSAQEVWHVPTAAQSVFDVTGAGDTVIATLGLALSAGHDLLTSCVLANHAAGLVVAQVGAAVATPETLAHALTALPAPRVTRWR